MIKAFEGGATYAEYEDLRKKRQAWQSELAELLNQPLPEKNPDILLGGKSRMDEIEAGMCELAEMIVGGGL